MFNFKKFLGYTLVEVSVAVFILTMITVAKLKDETRDLRLSIAKAQGQQVKVAQEGLYSYSLKNFSAIVNNTAVTGVTVTRAPTITELKTLGFIGSGFNTTAYYGANYLTTVTPAPAACLPADCNIQGLVYLNQPIRDPASGAVDGPAIGEAVRQIGADGGASIRVAGTIGGLSGGWSVANPLGATQGILGARIGMGSELDFTAYLRRDGTLPMTGNLSLGGNSVNGLAVSVEGAACPTTGELTTDATGSVLTCQGGLRTRQGSSYWRDSVANLAALPTCNAASTGQTRAVIDPAVNSPLIVGNEPRLYTCSGSAWTPVAVDDSGNLVVANRLTTGSIQVNTIVVEGAACAPNGLLARDAVGLILSCQTGTWKKAMGSSASLGEGQTWQNVIGSRALNATYTNSTGRPIQILVVPLQNGQNKSATFELVVNGVGLGGNYVWDNNAWASQPVAYSAVIPDGHTYRVNASGTFALSTWAELR